MEMAMSRKMFLAMVLAFGLVFVSGAGGNGVALAAKKTTFKKLNLKKKSKPQRTALAEREKNRRSINFFSGRKQVAERKALKRKANFKTRKVLEAARQKKAVNKVAFLGGGLAKTAFARKDGQIYSGGRYLGKTEVKFTRKLKPGTILVKTRERALYYVLPGGKAIKYGVGVGREGITWTGTHRITMKKEWPEWRPPEEMKERELKKYGRKLPDVMPGGPKNPLGARALYIGNTLYRIHGTNNPRSIGKFVSSGCIRMVNEEVIDLYERVKPGARVIVEN